MAKPRRPRRREAECIACWEGKHSKCGGWVNLNHGLKFKCDCKNAVHQTLKATCPACVKCNGSGE